LPACVGTIGGDAPVDESLVAPGPSLRRLLGTQYKNAVGDLLGDGAKVAATPPSDVQLNGFEAIGAAQLALGDAAVKEYESSARAVAAAAMGDSARIDALVGCAPTGPADAVCHASFIKNFGRLAWRRPLDAAEVERYTAVAQAAANDLGDFHAGVEYAIAAMLQSPNFLYQIELGAPDADRPHLRRLSGFEVAARMSFFLLDTTPDAELIDAAEKGELDTALGVKNAALAMLERPAAREALRGFYDELLGLQSLGSLAKNGDVYPAFTPSLADAMRTETLTLLEDIVWERDADMLELLDAPYTFVNAELAALYGLPAPAGEGFHRVDLPADQPRAGLLGQASFLSTFAHTATTSPTLRGKFVRERLLCMSIPAPPGNVVTSIPEGGEAKTMRDKLIAHQVNPSCAGCHVLMDNIGLALENFDGIGAFRTTENDVVIDASGNIDGKASFEGARELGSVLREDERVTSCVVKNLFRHGTGHVETEGESLAIAALGEAFAKDGRKLKGLLAEMVASEAFRFVGKVE
jgi:PAS domain-containing protein